MHNEDLIKPLQKEEIRGDLKYLMALVRVNIKKPEIKIERLVADNFFAKGGFYGEFRVSWRHFRQKTGLMFRPNQRSFRESFIGRLGVLSVLNPSSDTYKRYKKEAEVFLSLSSTVSREFSPVSQLTFNSCYSLPDLLEYLHKTGNIQRSVEIMDIWMKGKFTDKERKMLKEEILKETLKIAQWV